MRSISGFNGSSINGSFAAGEPISASALNKMASAIDMAKTGMSNDVQFLGDNGGTAYGLPQQVYEDRGYKQLLQQFEIVMQTVTEKVGDETVISPLLTVVQGNLICTDLLGANNAWVPEYTKSCLPPDGVTAWKGKESKVFINQLTGTAKDGPGGWKLPKAEGTGNSYGIYLVQVNNQKTDFDPIIFIADATEDWPNELPIVIPETVIDAEDLGVNEYPSYDLITIGTVTDDEDLKIWVIDQESIGTLTMPEPVKTGPQIPTWTPPEEKRPAPFECSQGRVTEDGQDFWCLKIGKGSMTYSLSNMPTIKDGAISNQHQAFYEICQVRYPNSDKAQDGADETSPWMVNGGYDLPQALGEYYLFAVMWDLNPNNIELSKDSVKGYPMLCLMDYDNAKECFKETGPSAYSNVMNIQAMTGYKNKLNGEKDFGFCHTMYFNPMKWGFAAKMIAKINVESDSGNECVISRLQEANGTRNRIDEIQFTAPVKSGGIRFSFKNGAETAEVSGYFYPAEEFARHLYNALQEIKVLKKNILVSQIDDRTFYVTYLNHLQMRDYYGNDLNDGQYELAVEVDELEWFDKTYKIEQYHTGSLDMTIPLQFNGTQLANKENWTEEGDWYNYNKENDWIDVVNKDDPFDFSGAYTVSNARPFGLVNNQTPSAYTTKNFNEFYYQEGGCSDVCKHPFYVKRNGTAGSIVWEVCLGTVNNVEPSNASDTFTLPDGYVWLRTSFNDPDYPSDVIIENGPTVPEDTDDYGYIAIAKITEDVPEQLVTGSLWSDRVKLGTSTPSYYWARV